MADIVYGMDNAEYHGHPAVGSSGLKLLERSPAHYWAAYRDPERERKEPSHYMRIGTAYHCAVFEPQEFRERYATGHDANPLTNRAKLLDTVLADNVKARVLQPDGTYQRAMTKRGMPALRSQARKRDVHTLSTPALAPPPQVPEGQQTNSVASPGPLCGLAPCAVPPRPACSPESSESKRASFRAEAKPSNSRL